MSMIKVAFSFNPKALWEGAKDAFKFGKPRPGIAKQTWTALKRKGLTPIRAATGTAFLGGGALAYGLKKRYKDPYVHR